MFISVKRLDPNAKLPWRANWSDAGNDLCAIHGGGIAPGKRALVDTGLAMAIPEGYYGRIADRSGLAAKKGVHVLGGVLDSLYRGPVKVILANLGEENFIWEPGDRIAQLIIEKCEDAAWVEVAELENTARGQNGFGSSGV